MDKTDPCATCRARDAPGARGRAEADAQLLGHALVRAARLSQHRARQTLPQAAQGVRRPLRLQLRLQSHTIFYTLGAQTRFVNKIFNILVYEYP